MLRQANLKGERMVSEEQFLDSSPLSKKEIYDLGYDLGKKHEKEIITKILEKLEENTKECKKFDGDNEEYVQALEHSSIWIKKELEKYDVLENTSESQGGKK